ncbi:MAG TPA: peptidoglycan-associated lipoprotein Pal [Acidobacteriaceae bacterium]|nr:peptidoglycan-associated lipoprotein Pal [Terriglobia bacterium]HVC91355.1 peptidoglycan-associated lipoprotein Pal [Acidobacteriaceae bacterium]
MKNYKKNSALASAALVAFLITTGCHHKEAAAPPPPPPPAETAPAPTANITVTPNSIAPGQSAVLNWTTTNATDVSIDGIGAVETSGTKTVSPTETATYHLVARGDGGSTDATATLTVAAPQAAPAPQQLTEAEFEQNVKPIFFDYDAYSVRPDAQAVISQDASFLQSHPDAKILIAGYCDDRGSSEYNLALGQNRANAAKTALTQAGIDASRIRTISYGKEKQFCTEQNESCWQQNRRAQFSLDQ